MDIYHQAVPLAATPIHRERPKAKAKFVRRWPPGLPIE